MRFPDIEGNKMEQKIILSGLLEKISRLIPGNEISERELYFEISTPVKIGERSIRYSPEDKIMAGNLTLRSCKKEKNSVMYTIRSDNDRLLLLSNAIDYFCIDWVLEGGIPSRYNVTGDYFLKLCLSNFITGSEARISIKNFNETRKYN